MQRERDREKDEILRAEPEVGEGRRTRTEMTASQGQRGPEREGHQDRTTTYGGRVTETPRERGLWTEKRGSGSDGERERSQGREKNKAVDKRQKYKWKKEKVEVRRKRRREGGGRGQPWSQAPPRLLWVSSRSMKPPPGPLQPVHLQGSSATESPSRACLGCSREEGSTEAQKISLPKRWEI